MYVLVVFAVVMTGDAQEPFIPVTRNPIGYYQSEEACKSDINRQGAIFLAEFGGLEIGLSAAKCVEVKGLEGTPA